MANRKKIRRFTSDEVFGFYREWRDHISESDQRSEKHRKFAAGDQCAIRFYGDNKEEIMVNLLGRVVSTAKANAKNIEIQPNIFSLHANPDQKELRSYKSLFAYIMSLPMNKNSFACGLDNLIDNGYTAYRIFPRSVSDATLDKDIVVENITDNTRVFFDHKATSRDYSTGAFCGIKTKTRIGEIRAKFKGKYQNRKDNDPIDLIEFYYKCPAPYVYVRLQNNTYKRKDLVRELDYPVIIGTDDNGMPMYAEIVEKRDTVYYSCYTEDYKKSLCEPFDIGVNCLPMVYSDTLTKFVDCKHQAYPLCNDLVEPQICLNYQFSQLAALTKQLTGQKYLATSEHIHSKDAVDNAANINAKSGVILVDNLVTTADGANIGPIQVLPTSQLPGSLLQSIELTKNLMYEIAGNIIDVTKNQTVATSGVALDKMIKRSDLLQNALIIGHQHTVRKVSEVIRKFVPVVYRGYRLLAVEEYTDSDSVIEINKPNPNDPSIIENDVTDVLDKYTFYINLVPSKELERQNMLQFLSAAYQMDGTGQFFQSTKDIFAQSSGVSRSEEISRRISMDMPSFIMRWGTGAIDGDELKREQAKYQQQQQAAKEQAMMLDPQYQKMQQDLLNQRIQSAIMQKTLLVDSYRAKTERDRSENITYNESIKREDEYVKLLLDVQKLHEEAMKNQDAQALKEAELLFSAVMKMKDVRNNKD